jgi:hypothetical protein
MATRVVHAKSLILRAFLEPSCRDGEIPRIWYERNMDVCANAAASFAVRKFGTSKL